MLLPVGLVGTLQQRSHSNHGLHSIQLVSAPAMCGCSEGCRTSTCTYLAIDKDIMHLCCLHMHVKSILAHKVPQGTPQKG